MIIDEQTRRNLREAYNNLRDMDIGRSEASLDDATRFYGVSRKALQTYPTDRLVIGRERDMNAMLDRVTRKLTSVRSSIF